MIIDLPPGTGDVQITIAQLTRATGTVVVCTPQDVALLDARKAMAMFDKVNIPVLGLIENMSSFVCPKCGAETPIFSKGGIEKESEEKEVPFLGRIPIELDIRLSGDNGEPIVSSMPNSKIATSFKEMAQKLIDSVENQP
jgi:ATP-binding protein involved in chromosome partitioning